MKKIVLVIISSVFLNCASIHSMDMLALLNAINRKTQAGELPHLQMLQNDLNKAFLQEAKVGKALEEAIMNKKNNPSLDIDLSSFYKRHVEAVDSLENAKGVLFNAQLTEVRKMQTLSKISVEAEKLKELLKVFSNKPE